MIARYDMKVSTERYYDSCNNLAKDYSVRPQKARDGSWVLYDTHAKMIKKLQKKIELLEKGSGRRKRK